MKTPIRTASKPPAPSMGDMWERLDAASSRFARLQKAPEGSFSTVEYAERGGMRRDTALQRLELLERAGVIERCGLYVTSRGGRTMHWRLRDSQA